MHLTKMVSALLTVAMMTAAAAQQPVASTDVDTPTPLTTKTISGKGTKARVSYFYGFAAEPGTVVLTGTGKNAPSGMSNALGTEILTANAERLCSIFLGNTNQDKTEAANCSVDKAQPLILRIDLDEETIDYKVEIAGPVKLAAAGTATAVAQPAAGAGSTDIDAPTSMRGPTVAGVGTKQMTSYYYAFNAGPGEFRIIADGKNEPVGVAQALQLRVMNLRSEEICEVNLGNVTRDAREIATCRLDKRESLILRVNIDPNTIDWRARVDGAVDFEAYTAPKVITIALNEQVLFDSGQAVLKPESRQTLHEAAVRVKNFPTAVVTVAGHTDNVGSDAANLKLSQARAAAVKDYFVQQESIPAARLDVKGHGTTMPVADNATPEGRARNRRVEVVIAPK
jgi:outer membrane protein OmpA-like peptidoglycan-associated protein